MTIRAWRIVRRNHVATAFDGDAAKKAAGRWNSPGSAVVYTASSLPLAALEVLVHLPRESILAKFVSIPVDFDEGLAPRLFCLPLFNQTWIEPKVFRCVDRHPDKIRMRGIEEEVALVGNNHARNTEHWRGF